MYCYNLYTVPVSLLVRSFENSINQCSSYVCMGVKALRYIPIGLNQKVKIIICYRY